MIGLRFPLIGVDEDNDRKLFVGFDVALRRNTLDSFPVRLRLMLSHYHFVSNHAQVRIHFR